MWKICIFLILTSVSLSNAQKVEEGPYHNKMVVLPFASYTPETRLMFGVFSIYQFKPRGAGQETRASQIVSSGIYTLNRQLILECMPTVILKQEQWILDGSYQYAFFPDRYWGVGGYTSSDQEFYAAYRRINFQQNVLRKIASGLYAGPRFRWTRISKVEFTDQNEDPVPAESIPGADGSSLPGVGFSIRWDKRNSITYPTENHYLELTALYYPEFIGATHPHRSWQLDGRKYLDLLDNKKSIFAFHFRMRLTAGELPFQEYSVLGGREIMRGYYEGRFRDVNAAQVQAEFRQHIYKRFGFTLFAASGEVWNRMNELTFDNPKFAAGAGLRFNTNPKDMSNIRVDYSIGKHDRGLYVTIGEAF